MATKTLKFAGVMAFLLSLYACPKDDCGFVTRDAFTTDLATVLPNQNTYIVGDEITLTISLESENGYFIGDSVDIYLETSIEKVTVEDCEFFKILENNPFEIIDGSYSNFKPVLWYYPNEGKYSFKAIVQLNKVYSYSLSPAIFFYFKKPGDDCIAYSVNTTIEGLSGTTGFNFEVIQP